MTDEELAAYRDTLFDGFVGVVQAAGGAVDAGEDDTGNAGAMVQYDVGTVCDAALATAATFAVQSRDFADPARLEKLADNLRAAFLLHAQSFEQQLRASGALDMIKQSKRPN